MKNCFDNIRIKGLSEEFKSRLKEGMSDREIRELGTEIAMKHYDKLGQDMAKLSKAVGKKVEVTSDKKEGVKKEVEEKFAAKKKEVKERAKKTSAKEIINYKQKKLRQAVNKLDAPSDARSAALAFFSGEGVISEGVINELANVKKRYKAKKSAEVTGRDYIGSEGKSLDDTAHDIWENLDEGVKERVTDQDVKNALLDVMGSFDKRDAIRQEYLEKYGDKDANVLGVVSDEDMADYMEQWDAEIADIAKGEEAFIDDLKDFEDKFLQTEEHLNNLIEQYENETRASKEDEGKDSQDVTGSESKVDKEVSSRKVDVQPTERDRYAINNSWSAFHAKYPEVSKDEYFAIRDNAAKAKMTGINVGGNENTIEQYVEKARAVLQQLFPDTKIKTYETEAEYEAAGNIKGSEGLWVPKDKTIHINLERIRDVGANNTVFHEVIHPIVREALESRNEGINEAYDQLVAMKDEKGMEAVFSHASNYEGVYDQKVEAITEFLALVADGKIDPSKLTYDLSTKVVDLINKILKALGINKVISTPGDLKKLAESIKESFAKADAKAVAEVLGKRTEVGGKSMASIKDVRDKAEELIRNYPEKSKQELIDIFKKYIPEEEVSAIIDRVRGKEKSGTKEPPPKTPKEKVVTSDNEGLTSIKLADTSDTRERFGLPEYEKTAETEQQWIDQADDALRKGYSVPDLIKKMQNGYTPEAYEQVILAKQKAAFDAEIAKNPSPENIKKLRDFLNAADKIAGTRVGKSLRARQVMVGEGETLGDYIMEEMDSFGVEELTEQQIQEVTKEHENIKKKEAELKIEEEKTQAEISKKKAKASVERQKSATPRNRKTHEQRVAERKAIADKAREDLRKLRGSAQSTVVPYARELFVLAPHIGKYVESLIGEGVDNLSDIIRNVHNEFKDDIEGLTEKDIQDVIAGEYNEKKTGKTRNELLAKKRDIETEAKLLNEIDRLQKGDPKTKTEQQKRDENKRIAELKKQVRELTGKDPSALEEAYIKRMEAELAKINEELKQAVIEPPVPKVPMKLSPRGQEIKRQLNEAKRQRKVRLLKQEFESQTAWKKAGIKAVQVVNIPRTIMSSMDLSAPLRQGLLPTLSHPKMAAEASAMMLKAALNENVFNDYFEELKSDPRYEIMKKTDLAILDIDNPYLQAREESFMGAGIIENLPSTWVGKVPIANLAAKGLSGAVRGSEMAYVMYLNKMRVDLFNMFADQFEAKGKTYENSKKLYEQMAQYVGNVTGRGDLGPLENWGPVLNAAFFSPRLIASRLSMINPVYVAKLPIELKKAWARDMGAFLATTATVLGAFIAYGATQDDDDPEKITVELDPRSSDFMKIKQGRTRWDIMGGFQQYIRATSQIISGERKSSTTGDISELDGTGAFGTSRTDVAVNLFRNKLSPTASIIVDFAKGKNAMGEDVTLAGEAENYLTPMIWNSLKEAYQEKGIKRAVTVGVPSIFGVGGSTYKPQEVKEKGPTIYNLRTNESRKPTKEEYAEYEALKEKYFQEELDNMRKEGVFKDIYNEVTTDTKKGVNRVPPDSLTEEEVNKIQGLLKARATRRATDELFNKGEESTTK